MSEPPFKPALDRQSVGVGVAVDAAVDVQAQLCAAAKIIRRQGVVCYPTEAVWGLGCDPQSELAFERVLALKQRPADKGVIVIAADAAQIRPYADINSLDSVAREKLKHWWPGFVTVLLPKAATCPDYLTGAHDTVAVRLTANATVAALCRAAGTALVSTSANRNGQPPVADIDEARRIFADGVDGYVDAPLGGEPKPSRIMRWHNGAIEVIRD